MDHIVTFLFFPLSFLLFFCLVRRHTTNSDDVSSLQGPTPSSWTYGNMIEFILGLPAGKTELGWFAKYGDAFKLHACFGEERLMVSDPAAIKHILHDTSAFVKSRTHQLINLIGFGEGSVIYAHGDDHRRIRAVMNSMFTAARVRELTPTLETIAKDLTDELSSTSGSTVDAYHFLHQTTLRAITQAVIGYDTTTDKNYTSLYEDLMVTVSKRSKTGILADAILSRLPISSTKLLMNYPPPDLRKLVDHRTMTRKISADLLDSRLQSLNAEGAPENDLFSVLVRTNAKVLHGLSDDELKDQFGGITTAGEDTTANTLVWMLYVLSQHPEWQAMLRQEIREADRAASGVDYDRLPFLNAIIKEVMRFYPAGSFTEREAASDAIIPLSTPIVNSSGQQMTRVKVKRGRKVIISITAFNRLPSIWGDDADELNPSRSLDSRETASGGTIGPYANLLNFIGGPRTCLGWRFAILEIQVIISELMRNFVFSLPKGVSIRPASAITLVPMDDEGRTRLPLIVERL